MVGKNLSLTQSGVRDWLIQRITAVILALYLTFIVVFLALHSPLTYTAWSAFFGITAVRIFTCLALLSVVYHTWVGMWTIFTDYLKCPVSRTFFQVATILALLSNLVWGILIIIGR